MVIAGTLLHFLPHHCANLALDFKKHSFHHLLINIKHPVHWKHVIIEQVSDRIKHCCGACKSELLLLLEDFVS